MEPITTLRGHEHPLSSICFLQKSPFPPINDNDDNDDDENDNNNNDKDNDEISPTCKNNTTALLSPSSSYTFRCQNISTTSSQQQLSSSHPLFVNPERQDSERDVLPPLLASCDTNGNAHIWNLSTRRIISTLDSSSSSSSSRRRKRLPGLSLRRLSSPHFFYQTRGDGRHVQAANFCTTGGIVSIYDLNRCCSSSSWSSSSIVDIPTHSHTFCAAAPCYGHESLIVHPYGDDGSGVTMRDLRMDPCRMAAVGVMSGSGGGGDDGENYGMVTSVAGVTLSSSLMIVCGMESGHVFFHDCRYSRRRRHGDDKTTLLSQEQQQLGEWNRHESCHVSLGPDPVLCLDVTSSSSSKPNRQSVVAVAGVAGDAAELSSRNPEERGTISLLKASLDTTATAAATDDAAVTIDDDDNSSTPSQSSSSSSSLSCRVQSRLSTCRVGRSDSYGKPGVSSCRFLLRNNNAGTTMMFAVGGWDRRGRVFSRHGRLLAVLKGYHGDSVTTVDWMESGSEGGGGGGDGMAGLLGMGSADGRITLWDVNFSKKKKRG